MTHGCHAGIARWRTTTGTTVALAGNPNVGKSSVFNRLTGMGVETANYPGKTVEVNFATTRFRAREVGILDLPGTYALGCVSDDQWVARRALLDTRPDVVAVVLDATRLQRNLYLLLQILDLGVPVVVALNLVDEAWRHGIHIDALKLGRLLGIPVVPTVAVTGQGLDDLVATALSVADSATSPSASACWPSRPSRSRSALAGSPARSAARYGRDVEDAVARVATALEKHDADLPWHLPARAVALLLLEDDSETLTWLDTVAGRDTIRTELVEATATIGDEHDEPVAIRIARERHGLAGELAARAEARVATPSRVEARAWRLATAPDTGYPLLAIVIGAVFGILFFVGDALATALSGAWQTLVSPWIRAAVLAVLGDDAVARAVLWGVDGGVNAALSVGVPYVLVFYAMLSVLEDSGYLNAVAFLTDPFVHRVGLHGRAVIALVAGAGCNVPAIMGTRVLGSARERLIAATLVVLTPCSARTAVIAGAVGHYVGWLPALVIYAVATALGFGTGVALHRFLPGRSAGLVMEMFPFRRPCWRTTVKRTWHRFKGFVVFAAPIVLTGSLALGVLYETGLVWWLAAPLAPIVEGWLGLPAVAGLTLLFAVLRKELALQLLVTLAVVRHGAAGHDLTGFMTGAQIFTYALVNTIYVPCVATIAMLGRELGWPRAALVSAATVVLALAAGGVARWLA